MLNRTPIAWVRNPNGTLGFSWNPLAGCSPASTGCAHCYAERLASTRLAHLPAYSGLTNARRWTGEVRLFPEKLGEPLCRKKPAGIFVCDMGDLFHERVSNEQIAAIFGVMAACPQHRFYVLTKRAKRMREWFKWVASRGLNPWTECHAIALQLETGDDIATRSEEAPGRPWPLLNVAIGVTVENQDAADERIALLLQTPAALRFLSIEPLLGPVDLTQVNDGSWYDTEGAQLYCALTGRAYYRDGEHGLGGGPRLDWVIVGGESGPQARTCRVDWIRSIVRQCKDAGVPCFVKQYGANAIGDGNDVSDKVAREWDADGGNLWAVQRLPLRDRAGTDPSEWPEDLRSRQSPEGWP